MKPLLTTIIASLVGCATPYGMDTGETETRPRAPDFSDASENLSQEACYAGSNQDDPICLPIQSLDSDHRDYNYPTAQDPRYNGPTAYLDLRAQRGDTPLSRNMQLSELAEPHKGRWAVVQPHLIESLQLIRNDVGPLVVGSGYRSPAYNRYVGGAQFSRHLYGDAVDIYGLEASMRSIAAACEKHGASFIEVYDSHVHCDWRDETLDDGFFGDHDHNDWHGKINPHQSLSENETDVWEMETFAW